MFIVVVSLQTVRSGSGQRTDGRHDDDMLMFKELMDKYHGGAADRLAHAAQMPRPSHYSEYRIGAVPEEDPFGQFMSHIVVSTVASHRESYRSAVYHEPPQLEIIGV
ncbi:unnamed protein product [Prorocentrum cordatum]|uniref:Uncharacterized protein n=1 Tax=Prorocentrum cordatum TaxID=2364126 RepID=A0ABN9PDJ7_9DINO|nr:unnamed protein product [Polarella glacialis]